MVKFTRYDLLLKLHQAKGTSRIRLLELVRGDVRYAKTSMRVLAERMRELKKGELVTEKNKMLRVNPDNPRTWDLLAFLYWSRMKNRDYNMLLKGKTVDVFRAVFSGHHTLDAVIKKTRTSKPTALKHIRRLLENSFVQRVKQKPLIMKANVGDHSLYYINLLNLDFKNYEREYRLYPIPVVHSKKLMKDFIRLHTYSTVVTEGNTATEDDVGRILENLPVKLTPHEIMEVVDTEKAVELLLERRSHWITEEEIKGLHAVLMNGLIDTAGQYYYSNSKRIRGSPHKPPGSKEEVDSSMKAVVNFVRKYEKTVDPSILGVLVHFMFVGVHPFQDGNGRMARLLHSWILLKKGLSLFVYDPEKRLEYFSLLEKARESNIDGLMLFCNREHHEMINKHIRK